ncbi:MAG: 1-acyl-sn-glycerol-3-phosphate acyltransferase [Flavobacteriales bacterium]|nr:1-acyl-sn-glycerol-3-phosphate acyltransferase [Flavobacteriales bacterium]
MKKHIAKLILKLLGWKSEIKVPKERIERAVILCAPHTSNWDFLYAVLSFWALDTPVKIFIKDSHTKVWYGFIVEWLGGIGVDRGARNNMVEFAINLFKENKKMSLINTPEATRSFSKKWKKGFYYIAKGANVPIILSYADYSRKRAGFGKLIEVGDKTVDEVFDEIEGFFTPEMAKIPENFNPKIR